MKLKCIHIIFLSFIQIFSTPSFATSIYNLPNELFPLIFKNLDIQSYSQVSLINHNFNDILSQSTLKKIILENHFRELISDNSLNKTKIQWLINHKNFLIKNFLKDMRKNSLEILKEILAMPGVDSRRAFLSAVYVESAINIKAAQCISEGAAIDTVSNKEWDGIYRTFDVNLADSCQLATWNTAQDSMLLSAKNVLPIEGINLQKPRFDVAKFVKIQIPYLELSVAEDIGLAVSTLSEIMTFYWMKENNIDILKRYFSTVYMYLDQGGTLDQIEQKIITKLNDPTHVNNNFIIHLLDFYNLSKKVFLNPSIDLKSFNL